MKETCFHKEQNRTTTNRPALPVQHKLLALINIYMFPWWHINMYSIFIIFTFHFIWCGRNSHRSFSSSFSHFSCVISASNLYYLIIFITDESAAELNKNWFLKISGTVTRTKCKWNSEISSNLTFLYVATSLRLFGLNFLFLSRLLQRCDALVSFRNRNHLVSVKTSRWGLKCWFVHQKHDCLSRLPPDIINM